MCRRTLSLDCSSKLLGYIVMQDNILVVKLLCDCLLIVNPYSSSYYFYLHSAYHIALEDGLVQIFQDS